MTNTYDQLFIGGAWEKPSGTATFEVLNPATEEVVGIVPEATEADVDRAVALARAAFDDGPWPTMSLAERADALRPVLASLRERTAELTDLLIAEVGVPVSSCGAIQVAQPIETLAYYLDLVADYPLAVTRSLGKRSSEIFYEPVGVAAAIVPWNAPLRSIMNKLAPALLAGCPVIVKPAPTTPLNAMLLAEILDAADLPRGLVSVLPAERAVAAHLVAHPGIDKVAFTGSTAAGHQIMAACAANMTRVGLELGGKSAAIVLDDADLDKTIRRLVPNIVGNNGQACTAHTRVLASTARYDEVVDRLAAAFEKEVVGDPLDPASTIGPLASAAQRARVEGYFDSGREQGARIATGGGRPADLPRGFYVEATVFADVDNSMRVAREEIFGPVAAVLRYDGLDEAVDIANDSPYGLSGSIWSADEERALAVARRVRTGTISINGALQAPNAPFGGFKKSGFGREYGPEGFAAFLESKAVATRPL